MSLSENIKKRRLELKYSLQQLSELTHISKSTLHRYENGSDKIPVDKLGLIAEHLKVDVSYLTDEYNDDSTHTEEFYRTKALVDLYYNGVLNWSSDKLFSEQEKINLLEHFSQLLISYKQLCEARLNARLYWMDNRNKEIEYFSSKDPGISKEEVAKLYLKNYLRNEIENLNQCIVSFINKNPLD